MPINNPINNIEEMDCEDRYFDLLDLWRSYEIDLEMETVEWYSGYYLSGQKSSSCTLGAFTGFGGSNPYIPHNDY